jgi:hypothetical protein
MVRGWHVGAVERFDATASRRALKILQVRRRHAFSRKRQHRNTVTTRQAANEMQNSLCGSVVGRSRKLTSQDQNVHPLQPGSSTKTMDLRLSVNRSSRAPDARAIYSLNRMVEMPEP